MGPSVRSRVGPLNTPYLKLMSITLSILAFWPDEVSGKKRIINRSSKKMLVFYFFVTVLCVLYIKNNVKIQPFLEMGPNYINTLLLVVCLSRLIIPCSASYKELTNTFFNDIHLFHFKDQNEFAMKTYKEVEKYASFFCKILHFEVTSGVFFYNLTPLYKSYRNGMFKDIKPANATYEQAVYYEMPFDYINQFPGFLAVYLANCFISFDVAFIAGIFDLYVYVIIFNLWGHLKILKNNLITFPKPKTFVGTSYNTMPWYSEEESKEVRKLLIKSIEHYKSIKNFMNDMSGLFGPALCCYFSYFQICGCILLVESTQMTAEAIGTHGILTFTTFQQLIQISVIFELIGTQSDTIQDAIYEVPWECMDVKNKKIVLFYLLIAQKPLSFKPLGMVSVGVQTMASILKTTISYFMLLRTTTSSHE
uniref:Odorant receptor n=1 Tax=Semiothisa cinerearia TaxID=2249628 RepID=A0A889XL75_9NEOP|nr:odorant receptor [Semiothisa cinerearia]